MAETTEVRISTEGGWNCSVKAPWHDSGGYLVYRVMKIAGLSAVKRIDGQRGNYTG